MLSRVLIVKGCSAMEYVSKVLITGYKLETAAFVVYSELTETFVCVSDILRGQKVSLNSLYSSILS